MQLFIGDIVNGLVVLNADETRHASKVLRKHLGDTIEVINGKGSLYVSRIIGITKSKLEAEIISQKDDFGAFPYELHVAIAPTKNIDRFEWFLEKATELGITSINPIITQNSERTVIKPERLNRVLVSATKQSLKGRVPELKPLIKFKEFVKQEFAGDRFIAHCEDQSKVEFANAINPSKPIMVCIGPEGDFSPTEIDEALKNNFKSVAFGPSRLRTETAGVYAVSTVYSKST